MNNKYIKELFDEHHETYKRLLAFDRELSNEGIHTTNRGMEVQIYKGIKKIADILEKKILMEKCKTGAYDIKFYFEYDGITYFQIADIE